MTKGELLAAIDAERESHITFLQDFIRAPSPNPPGDTRVAADVVLAYLASRGVPSEVVAPRSEMPNVVSEFNGARSGPRLILNGHIDVFPVGEAAGWTRDPWSGDIDDGMVHGRGAVDMKAGTAASIIAFAYLYERRHLLAGSAGLTVVSDEETGGKWGSRWLLENDMRWHGDCMINGEPGSLHNIRFAEKGTLRITFQIKTAGAHGAYLHRSKSATRIAAKLIERLAEVEDIQPDMPPHLATYLQRQDVKDAINAAMGEGAANYAARTTLNIGTVHGGLKVNMIPDLCTFEADIRMPMGLVAAQVMEHVNRILQDFPQASASTQEAASNPASGCAHDHPMVSIMADNAFAVTGLRPLATPSMGATDCKFWRYLGIPAYIYGPSPSGMAAPDEAVAVEEFLAVLKTHALSAWDYLGGQQ